VTDYSEVVKKARSVSGIIWLSDAQT